MLEAARSQIAATVSDAEVAALPMNGRNFLDVALLVPGVAPANIASTQLFPETSAVPGVSLSVGSQRNLSNNFVVDGLSANDDAAGLSGMTYGVDAIEQMQVVTSGAQAELGRALGGYINVVTKSGSNAFRGTVYDFVRDDQPERRQRAVGHDPADEPVAVRRQRRRADREEPDVLLRQRRAARARSDRPRHHLRAQRRGDQRAADAARATWGRAITTGVYPNPVDTLNVIAKIDHQFSSRDQFSVRYSRYGVTADNSRGAGGLSAPTASSNLDNTDQAIAFSNTLILSPRTVLETRAQFANGDLKAPPSDLIGPAVSIAGVASFGTSSSSPTGRLNKMFQIVNNLSHQAGAHALRAGVDFLYNDDLITFPRSVRGSYTFSSMANFLTGVYNNAGFAQTFGITELGQTNPNLGVYAQDEWKVTPDVTLNLGLRYDLQFLETINTDTNNVSPRVGIAWSPFESRRTIVRGGAGLFYDRVPLRALANALMSAGNTTDVTALRQYVVSLSPTQAGAPVFPNILPAAVPLVTLPNLTTMDRGPAECVSRGRSAPRSSSNSAARTTLGVGYQYLDGSGLLMSVNQNVPTCVASGTNNGCRPDVDLRQQQPVLVGRRLDLSRPARLAVAAHGAVGPVPRVVHAVEGHEQRRRVLLQLADRSHRPVERLGPVRQRPAAPAGVQRLDPLVAGAGQRRVGTPHARLPVQRHAAGLLGAALQHHLGRDHHPGHAGPADRRRRVHRPQRRRRHARSSASARASAARSG